MVVGFLVRLAICYGYVMDIWMDMLWMAVMDIMEHE
jgi:hypothetical protein